MTWEYKQAEREFRRSIELNPGYATAHHWYATLLCSLGRHDEAIAELERARELDPLSLPILNGLASTLSFAGRSGEADRTLRKILEMAPEYVTAHQNLAENSGSADRCDKALEELAIVSRLSPEAVSPDFVAELRTGFETSGARGYWEAWVRGLSRHKIHQGPFYKAIACTKLGRLDEAFACLERLVAERDPVVLQIYAHPSFAALREDPRYPELVRRLGLG